MKEKEKNMGEKSWINKYEWKTKMNARERGRKKKIKKKDTLSL